MTLNQPIKKKNIFQFFFKCKDVNSFQSVNSKISTLLSDPHGEKKVALAHWTTQISSYSNMTEINTFLERIWTSFRVERRVVHGDDMRQLNWRCVNLHLFALLYGPTRGSLAKKHHRNTVNRLPRSQRLLAFVPNWERGGKRWWGKFKYDNIERSGSLFPV